MAAGVEATHSTAKSTLEDRVTVSFRDRVLVDTPRFLSRAVFLCALVYLMWRKGGTDAVAQWHLTLAAIFCTVFQVISLLMDRRPQRINLAFALTLFSGVALAGLQLIPVSSQVLQSVAPGTHTVIDNLVRPTAEQLSAAIEKLNVSDFKPLATDFVRPISVHPQLTRNRLAIYTLGVSFFLLSSTLFTNRRSRVWLAWAIITNTAAIAVWGIVQRSTGTNELFPGVETEITTRPFSTFVYKNAGAAAVIPGLAIALGLLISNTPGAMRVRTSRSGLNKSKSMPNVETRFGYRQTPRWLEPKSLLLIILVCVMLSGVVVSGSRGALVAVVTGFCVAVALLPVKRVVGTIAVPVAAVLALSVLVLWASDSRDAVLEQKERLSLTTVSLDTRWNHWPDALAAARRYLPLGSGLGTFGYAHLPVQTADRLEWFREAHNQYLEVLVENGLPGVLLIAVLLTLVARSTIFLIRNAITSEHLAWGIAAAIATVALAVQSSIDFVIIIPGVMVTFAALMGCVSSVYLGECLRSEGIRIDGSNLSISRGGERLLNQPRRFWHAIKSPAMWCLIGLMIPLGIASENLRGTVRAQSVLNITNYPPGNGKPSIEEISFSLTQLDNEINEQPSRGDLYRRRATWNFASYRVALLSEFAKAGIPITWEQTSQNSLFENFAVRNEEGQSTLRSELLKSTRLKSNLAATLYDLGQSLVHNPLVPPTHLACAVISPIAAMDCRVPMTSVQGLSRCSRDVQFSTGLVAFQLGEMDVATDQWKRSLVGDTKHLNAIFTIASTEMNIAEIGAKIIPEKRGELLAELVRMKSQRGTSPESLESDVSTFVERIRGFQSVSETDKCVWTAKVFAANQQWADAAKAWQSALDIAPNQLDYRFELAINLMLTGELDEALRHANIGCLLETSRGRYDDLHRRVLTELKKNGAIPDH